MLRLHAYLSSCAGFALICGTPLMANAQNLGGAALSGVMRASLVSVCIAGDEPRSASDETEDTLALLRKNGLAPKNARVEGTLTERDMTELIHRILRHPGSEGVEPAVMKPTSMVTRLRAVSALVKASLSAKEIEEARDAEAEELTPDAQQIPAWGKPFVASAVKHGWWSSEEALHPNDRATWGFVAEVIAQMPIGDLEEGDEDAAKESYTGLIVDAREFSLERSPNPEIRDEDGAIVYPDPKHLPSADYVEDHGMASYEETAEDAKRAGRHPLIVHALRITGAGNDNIVVSNETAELIRKANQRHKFLGRFAVSILQAAR